MGRWGRRRAWCSEGRDIEVGPGARPGAAQAAVAVFGEALRIDAQEIIGAGRVDADFWPRRHAAGVAGVGQRFGEDVGGWLAGRRRVWTDKDGHLQPPQPPLVCILYCPPLSPI